MSAEKIIGDWKKGVFKPIYWLEGDEPFYIDTIIDYAEKHILSESEAGFNLSVFYGRDADWANVINSCRRYPMFAEKQLVLLKEAQHMKDIDKLEGYMENPLASTILVIGYKDKKVDGRSKMAKVLKQRGEVLTTKKLWENELPAWISSLAAGKGFQINPKAVMLLVDHIGNDLSRISNEIEKVTINLGTRKQITEDDIEAFVGISKEYNALELEHALTQRNLTKCLQIIQYFESNPKALPIQLLLPTLYSFFSKAYLVFGAGTNDENQLAQYLGYKSAYGSYVKDIISCARSFRQAGVEKAILLLHEYNLKSIGINSGSATNADLLKEMVVKMIN
ncbi:MAG: DNA polymerase III subunit delta [Bacteroidota bacterium]